MPFICPSFWESNSKHLKWTTNPSFRKVTSRLNTEQPDTTVSLVFGIVKISAREAAAKHKSSFLPAQKKYGFAKCF